MEKRTRHVTVCLGLLLAAVGNGVTSAVPLLPICSGLSCAVWWTAGQADPVGTCDLRMTVESSGELLVDQPIVGVTQGVALWMEEGAAIVVDSDWSWSLEVRWGPQP